MGRRSDRRPILEGDTMDIIISKCADDPRRMVKTTTDAKTVTVNIKEETDVNAPVFYLAYDADIIEQHYNYVQAWGRFYFMSPPQVVPGQGMRISCKQDTLSTYAAQLANCPAIISRCSAAPNTYLSDSEIQTAAYALQQVLPFSAFSYFNQAIIVCVG